MTIEILADAGRALPDGWTMRRLDDLGDTFGGLSGKTKPDFGAGSARYITFLNVLEHAVLDPSLFEPVRISASERQTRARAGDLFFNGSSETPEEVGMCGLLAEDHDDLYLNSFCMGFRLNPGAGVEPLYLAYFFRSSLGRQLFRSLAQGSTRYNLSKAGLKGLVVPLPPRTEQRRIALALSDMDQLARSLRAVAAKNRQLRDAAARRLLAGEVRLGGFTGEWSPRQVGELGVFSKGRGIRKDQVSASGLPCVRYGEIYTTHNDFIRQFGSFITPEVARTSQRLKMGDLLFAASGETSEEIGKCVAFLGIEEAYAGGDIVILSPARHDPKFLGYLMNSGAVVAQKARFGQGDAVVHISTTNLASIVVGLPPIDEQRAIAQVLTDMDAEVIAVEREIDKMEAVKTGAMRALFSGRARLGASAATVMGETVT